MGSGLVAKAVIAGHDGTLWAKSNNIEVSNGEELALFAGWVLCVRVCVSVRVSVSVASSV